jgi:hypothetical protein
MPTHMDTRDAVNMHVRRGTRLTARLPLCDDGGVALELPPELLTLATVAVCRANNIIPSSVPAFYFEVTVVRAGVPVGGGGEAAGAHIAVGLLRDWRAATGRRRQQRLRYSGSMAAVMYSNDDGELMPTPIGPTRGFAEGDVVGCVYDTRRNAVCFTLNGALLSGEPAVRRVQGRLFPCVWLSAQGACVSVNFGQRPYRYDFVATLGADYLQNLEREIQRSSKMTPAELQRRARAENLLTMFPHFPLDLCALALERCRDDLSTAASWLIENGYSELDRLANETLQQTAQAEAL